MKKKYYYLLLVLLIILITYIVIINKNTDDFSNPPLGEALPPINNPNFIINHEVGER